MAEFLFAILTQSLTFLPLAFGISISYTMLRATDMTLDASFVIGAGVFARLITLHVSPELAAIAALSCGTLAGILAALIQRGGRVDPLLAGVLATFILSSVNLMIMGKPNINLLAQTTLVSFAFDKNDILGWLLVASYAFSCCAMVIVLLSTSFGLCLRAFGDNANLLHRLGKNREAYRLAGFALTNSLSAAAGCLTAQTVGYADIGMGFGMTLTGIGAILLGQQLLKRLIKINYFRLTAEFTACLLGVLMYFFTVNSLLRLDVNPIYLKMLLGVMLALFLRAAIKPSSQGIAL